MTRPVICVAVLIASTLIAAPSALASGHGPLFGGARPVLGKGGWSFDAAWMARSSEDAFAQALPDDDQLWSNRDAARPMGGGATVMHGHA